LWPEGFAGDAELPDPTEHTLTLTRDEANVLFELLGRWAEEGGLAKVRALTEHEAEVWALNDLYCILETVITPGVEGGLAGARARLMERHGGEPFPD
jgi:hypothetical protein